MVESIGGLTLVLLGKIGVGKSASGNTILGREAFLAKKSSRSVTRDLAVESGTVDGFPVTVYDTPGLFNTTLSEEETQQILEKVLQECESRRCVFLLVIKSDRFTEKQRKTVEKIEKLLGENRLKKTWILFTGGDQLEEENMTINEFINETESLKKLVHRYDQRYRVFNNKTKESSEQVQELLIKIYETYPDAIVSDLRILLLGENTSENNRVGNFIFNDNVFGKKTSPSDVEMFSQTVEGRNITIINTINILKSNLSHTQISQKVSALSPAEPDVIILVLQHNDFSERKRLRLPSVLKCFGDQMMKRSMILTTDDEKRIAAQQPVNEYIQEISTECGGFLQLTQNTQRSQILQQLDEIITCFEETHQISSLDQEHTPTVFSMSKKQKLVLALCGCNEEMKASMSKLLLGKNTAISAQEFRSECVRRDVEINGRQISLVELPALNRLSEEEMMHQTLICVSRCDPGVHAFLIIVPVGPLTDEDKAAIEKILKIFRSREHFMLLFTTNLTDEGFATDFVQCSPESQRLIHCCEGQYRVMWLKEPEYSRQIPELLDYIEKMKTEPYSLQMYVKAQENRVRNEMEEQHKKDMSKMENKIRELEQKNQRDGAEGGSDDQECLRIVLFGRTGSGKSATGNTILGRNEFQSQLSTDSVTKVCQKRVGEVAGRSVAVVDTPGLFDTTLTHEQVIEEIVKCVSLSSPGPHVFVIVLSLERLTREEAETIDFIKKIFGHEAAQFSIVLFTRGDELGNESIEYYVKRSKSAELKKLIRDCGNRFLTFNNREKEDKTQVIQLLNMIEEVKNMNQGRYFTNSMFEEAEMSIKQRMEEILKEREEEIQTQHEKLRVTYETEMEDMMKILEEEKQRADEEKIKMKNQLREKEKKLIKEFEEKEKIEQKKQEMENEKRLEEEKQQKAEYHNKIEEMKREIENQRSQYEKQQKEREEEDRRREEKYRQDQEKMTNEQKCIIAEIQMKQEEIKNKDLEERKRTEQEEKERQEWEQKIKQAENDRKDIQEEIKQQQRKWEDEKDRESRERGEAERKRKEKHEEQLREKQEELEKMRKRFEKEREEEGQKIEDERQKQRRENEQKEREYEEKKTELKTYYETLERERKEEWERRKQEEEEERREEERKRWKKRIEDLKQEQEEEIKRTEIEEKKRKGREKKERDEMKQKHDEVIKEMKRKYEDEARKQAEELNDFRERKEEHIQELQQKMDEHQKERKLLEELYKKLQQEVNKLCETPQEQKENEINELKKQVEALSTLPKNQQGEKIEKLQEKAKKLCESLQDLKGDKVKEIQEECEKLNQLLQDKKEEHLNTIKNEAEEKVNESGSCVIQ